ncbi:CRTAC1 family protein [bacterium]|nr:CRTAC1 family protein [bacterium]
MGIRPCNIRNHRISATTVIALCAICGCSGERSAEADRSRPPQPKTNPGSSKIAEPVKSAPGPIRFVDMTQKLGIDFRHVSGSTDDKAVPTANGSGVAVFDFDGDGRMDLYFAQSTFLPVNPAAGHTGRLYRNGADGRFVEVTAGSGLDARTHFTHAAIAGDIDNDGDPDLYLCNYGKNVLFRNDGGGKFVDISSQSRTDFEGWSSSAAFLDYDADGLLDLYVSTYADWKYPDDNRFCGDVAKKVRLYCDPKELRPAPDRLFRNLGGGKFEDVSKRAGIDRPDGHGFGVIAADLNVDGKIDLYVANDQDPNFLFLNRGDGTFEDATAVAGAALDSRGHAQAGMGVDAEDVDGDGLPEIVVTNFSNEPNTLYRNMGQGLFMDVTSAWGLTAISLPWVGWGTTLTDFDTDGFPDLFVADGHLDDNRHLLGVEFSQPEPPLLLRNIEGKRFENVAAGAGDYFGTKHVGRGVGWGDLDNDGDVDLVISHKDGPPGILFNESPRAGRHFLRLKLQGTKSNRDAIGTLVEFESGGRKIVRQVKGGCGLMSSHDNRLTVGLGEVPKIDLLTVRWPSGKVTTKKDVAVDGELHLTEE